MNHRSSFDPVARHEPRFLLIPVAMGYRPELAIGTFGDYALHARSDPSPPDWLYRKTMGAVPLATSSRPLAHVVTMSQITLTAVQWTEEWGVYGRWERRYYARREWPARPRGKGRRGALAVPLETRSTAVVYVVEGTPDEAIGMAMRGRLPVTERRWR